MAMDTRESPLSRDTTLPPDTFLYMQNAGKGGIINVFQGPFVVSQSGQDVPVKFDPKNDKYVSCESLAAAVQHCPRAKEGDYVVLENPAENAEFPSQNQQQAAPLRKGCKVIIPGPWSKSLWPGQKADVIEGHRLRTNQYLIAIIYNAKEAQNNWETGTIVVSQTDTNPTGATPPVATPNPTPPERRGLPKPESFAVGTRIVIKGSDVSFYIPCTGVEVVRDKNSQFVRDAVTLEQLEYACLVGEDGKKEYPRGPQVVFPRATQTFEEDKKQRKTFSPIELNKINGIHLKVTADFKGPNIESEANEERQYREGEELFVTGKTLSIYYPREELSVIEYGQGNRKHFSTAVPLGEGRYVINRETGEIKLIKGPMMLLCDPRRDIPVRRILSETECELWYPGNAEAKSYNRELAQIAAESPSGRSGGVVSEGDVRKQQLVSHSNFGGRRGLEFTQGSELEAVEVEEGAPMSTMTRGSRHTKPRQLTLNTKFDGVPRIEVWSGYAVLVIGADGRRRVEEGPSVVLLQYDEKLGFMKLSTGKPKTTDKYFTTSYLCTLNNQVGDIVPFESKDHIKGSIKISLRVNFEAETQEQKLRWFSTDNYVKYLCDHVRSKLAGMAKKKTIAEIKSDYVDLVRDTILGPKQEKEGVRSRPGLSFDSNGMRVVDVEVLDITLSDIKISNLLDGSQHKTVTTNIEIEQARKELEATQEKERIERAKAQASSETEQFKRNLKKLDLAEQIQLLQSEINKELQKLENDRVTEEKRQEIEKFKKEEEIARLKIADDHTNDVARQKLQVDLERLDAETKATCARFEASKEGLADVLLLIHSEDMASKLAGAMNIERYLSGDGIGSILANLVSQFPTLQNFMEKATPNSSSKTNRLKNNETPAVK